MGRWRRRCGPPFLRYQTPPWVGFSVPLPRSSARSRWWCAVCATGAGERRRTTATPVSPVPAVAPPRRTAAASGRRSSEERLRACLALPPDKWPALRSLLPHGLTSALSPGCCASYAPNNADVVPADTPSESPPPNPHSHPSRSAPGACLPPRGDTDPGASLPSRPDSLPDCAETPASDACPLAARRKPPASLPACVPLDAADRKSVV